MRRRRPIDGSAHTVTGYEAISRAHGFDVDIWLAAAMEAATAAKTFTVRRVEDHPCAKCGHLGPHLVYRRTSADRAASAAETLELSVRAALLAGWDGESGCYGRGADRRETAARLQAEGFGQRSQCRSL